MTSTSRRQKTRYEVDPYNRLIIDRKGAAGCLHKFRKVLDGKFKVDGNNALSYHVKAPLAGNETIPHKIRIAGDWSLTPDHSLKLTLDKEGRKTFGNEITLQGQILDVGGDSLAFAVTTRLAAGRQSTYILNLQGVWRADENNRLSFYLRREAGRYNILTFNGAWEINKDHQIVYNYEKGVLVRKRRERHTLLFKGYWDIRKKGRISYSFEGRSDSAFDFKAGAAVLEEDYVKYEVGIGLGSGAIPARRVLTLSGGWKLKKDAGLVFEAEYDGPKIRSILFGADVEFTDRDTVVFRLRDSIDSKDLGISLRLSRKILEGSGEAFLRAIASGSEAAFSAGAAWRW
ncbi:MAG: hypothetical protein WC522_05050 [Candidatus Omnitrophota bacterium]